MESDDHKPFSIRSYRASDREAVRKLCCNTGFLGDPIDPVYEDRELFADFLTTYYTDHEPESCFLLEVDGEIRGYLLGSRKPLRNQLYALYQNVWLFFRALIRYFRYHERSRRFIRWTLVHGWHELPARPRRVPHFHINLLPDARKVSTTRALMSAYLSYLYRSGEKRVYGQIVTFESRRGEKMLAEIRNQLSVVQEGRVIILPPPPLRGLGNAGGAWADHRDRCRQSWNASVHYSAVAAEAGRVGIGM